jgi:hypothetical protein
MTPAQVPPLELTQTATMLGSMLGAPVRPVSTERGWRLAIVFTPEQASAMIDLHDSIVRLPNTLASVRRSGEP